MWERLSNRVIGHIWGVDIDTVSRPRAVWLRLARMVYAAAHDLQRGELNLRAMSLVYTTLLSLVPLLAVSFSVLQAFGVHGQLRPVLQNYLAPLGQQGLELADNIVLFVDNIRVGLLGFVGLLFLFYTVIALIQKAEEAFNHIWHVRQPRGMAGRVTTYLSVVMIGPVLVVSLIGITTSVKATTIVQDVLTIRAIDMVVYGFGLVMPLLLVIALFAVVYFLVPNTRVRFSSALLGGALAGVLWEITGWVFTWFAATSTRYEAIYSGFAILILFMIWVYLSWLIVLFGAQLSFYHQQPPVFRSGGQPLELSKRLQEKLALFIMYVVGESHFRGSAPWTAERFARELHVPEYQVRDMLAVLERGQLVVEAAAPAGGYLPARELETIGLAEVLGAVRRTGESAEAGELVHTVPAVDGVAERLEQALAGVTGDATLRDLVVGAGAAEGRRSVRVSPAHGEARRESG